VPVVNDLLEELQREGFHIYGCADDIAIVVGGHFLTALRDLMNALKMTYRWCETEGLMISSQKTNVMIFSRAYKHEPIES
jgi:hypothetical protein